MVVIDGSQHSGSGTIVRYAVALAALLREPVRVINVRHSRTQPGLRPQHVASVRACAQLSGTLTDGVQVDSREFTFTPGERISGGTFEWNIGTAGSTTMLALGVLAPRVLRRQPDAGAHRGWSFRDVARAPHHLRELL